MEKFELERMENLIKEINIHNHNYYVLDKPTISDKDYDKLYDELVKLEKSTGVTLDYSPTKRVGGEVLEGFKKFQHRVPLYSLEKCNSYAGIEKFVSDIKKVAPEAEFSVEYKFDGLSIVVEYENGVFVRAGTRGNGKVGEDVSLQVQTIKSVPLKIDYKGKLIVQGEGMITLPNLEKYNKTATEPLKNARNAVAGAIRNLDPKVTASRRLDLFSYSINYISDKVFKTQAECMQFLKNNGFKVADFFHIAKTSQEIKAVVDEVDKIKRNLDILMDGIVIKLNQIDLRDEFGYTSKFPKWAIAYKFEAQEASTILNNVVWQVGRTGKITPIAEVEPVELAGASIKRATLNNVGDIERKKVKIGSRVFLRRSNEVIPEILGIAEDLPNSKEIIVPENCPCCGQKLVNIGANLFCLNRDGCSDQIVDRLTHFASKDALNIEGFSEKTALILFEKYNVINPHELFDITRDMLLKLDSFKDKKADNLIFAINKSKVVNLSNFIYALAISGVGKKTALDLAKTFKTLNNLKSASLEDLINIKDIGDVIAENIYKFFNDSKNLQEINSLLEKGIEIKEIEEKENAVFSNKTVVLTGSLEEFTRHEATNLLESLGANVSSSVSSKTDFVLAGENAGSKLDKAKSLGIKIISEKEFKELIKNV